MKPIKQLIQLLLLLSTVPFIILGAVAGFFFNAFMAGTMQGEKILFRITEKNG